MENINSEINKEKGQSNISVLELTPPQSNILLELRKTIDNPNGEKVIREALKYAQKREGQIAFIATDNNQPLGYIELKNKGDLPKSLKVETNLDNFVHLARIGVKSESRRKGVAHNLVDKAQEWAIKEEKAGLWLDYRQDNTAAAKFYENSGFINIKKFEDKKGITRFLAIKKFNS